MRLPDRGSGLLLPIPSLPSRFGIGDAGPAACEFADRLAAADQRYWQILPLNPTSAAYGHSPYHAVSAFALNPLFISPEFLVRDGVISSRDLSLLKEDQSTSIDYQTVVPRKMSFLRSIAASGSYGKNDPEFDEFCAEHEHWLGDYALFTAIEQHHGGCWTAWPPELRDRNPEALNGLLRTMKPAIQEPRYLQFLIFTQWTALKASCRNDGIRLIGDLPMFLAHESVDVWAHRTLFNLADDGTPLAVAGVPPDYFSRDGQRWGNPVYNWEEMERCGFSWWTERIRHTLGWCDLLRIDHFRGFSAYWEIPAESENSREGRFVPVPGRALLSMLSCQELPLIAEDLGIITPDVRSLMEEFHIPGTRVLQFGFDDVRNNPHAPGNIGEQVVLYTGTHDNNTLNGWFSEDTSPDERERIASALGSLPSPRDLPRAMIRLALESPARVVIIPVQDLLGLPSSARMNRPGTTTGNWTWRLPRGYPIKDDWAWLGSETTRTGRNCQVPDKSRRERNTVPAGDRYWE